MPYATTGKRLIEAEAMRERLEYHGFQVIYGGVKGHGFWIKGIGWLDMLACEALLPY